MTVIFGDSLTARAAPLLSGHEIHAVAGYQVTDWLDEMERLPAGSTVVVALGTNDNRLNTGAVAQQNATRALEALRPADCVVWLTLNRTTAALLGDPRKARTHYYNQFLVDTEAAGTHPNLHLSLWSATSLGRTDWLDASHVHHNAAGNAAYAAQLAAAAACPPRSQP